MVLSSKGKTVIQVLAKVRTAAILARANLLTTPSATLRMTSAAPIPVSWLHQAKYADLQLAVVVTSKRNAREHQLNAHRTSLSQMVGLHLKSTFPQADLPRAVVWIR